MIDIDWHSIFVTGAGVVTLLMVGLVLMFGAFYKIGLEFKRRNDEQAEEAMASMPDAVLLDAIRLYDGH